MAPSRLTVALLLLASLLVGLGHIALLPPFEGFDETAHYSYIQQVAETGTWPRRDGRMSKEIDDYLKVAPTTEMMHGAWTYFGFFSTGTAAVEAGRQAIWTAPAPPRTFAPGEQGNWQAQHPPLYYAVMAPAYWLSKGWSLGAQLFTLRSVSYLIAWGALVLTIVVLSCRRTPAPAWLPLALAAWPFLFPMWFPEMGRIGNDNLVTIFAACVFLLAWPVTTSARLGHHTLLGLALGLGLLTKVIFLPVVPAILLVLAIQTLLACKKPGEFSRRLAGLCVAVAVLVAVAGWWYALKLIETGAITGSIEAARMQEAGGLIAGLMRNLTVVDLVSIPRGLFLSFFWAGTWSFLQPPRIAYLPFLLFVVILTISITRTMRRGDFKAIDWLPVTSVVMFLAALTYYSLVTITTGAGTSPAWYLHAMAPIMALLVGRGIVDAMRGTWLRCALTALWFYPLALLAVMTTMNLIYFAGCAEKLPDRLYFSRERAAECLADTPRMIENLSVIAMPHAGIALFAIGWVIAAIAMTLALRCFRAAPYSTASTR